MPRMPHNNRMSSSDALRTNDIWSKTIGHNPYAADEEKNKVAEDTSEQTAGLMLLARMTNISGVGTRGGCAKCGLLGHLTFQCRNTPAVAEEDSDSDSSSDESNDDRQVDRRDDFQRGDGRSRDRSRSFSGERSRDKRSRSRSHGRDDRNSRGGDRREQQDVSFVSGRHNTERHKRSRSRSRDRKKSHKHSHRSHKHSKHSKHSKSSKKHKSHKDR